MYFEVVKVKVRPSYVWAFDIIQVPPNLRPKLSSFQIATID